MPHIIVGTAGHIDHGKTALVKALTGIDADRLKEEKERGITIDIGFANLDLDETTRIGFVDVPGHERFVKNMLAGIGGIDVVMLVVAADESVMPQTREHLEICSLLRIRHGLTVITKIDAVDEEIAGLVELEVREYLKPTFLGEAPIVRVSAHTGAGKAVLIETLREIAQHVSPKDTAQIFRLPVDRCFTMKGFGTGRDGYARFRGRSKGRRGCLAALGPCRSCSWPPGARTGNRPGPGGSAYGDQPAGCRHGRCAPRHGPG